MRRPFRGDMPIALTLPLHFDLRIRARRRRRLMIAVLLALAGTIVAAGLWLPARAEQQSSNQCETHSRGLRDLTIGDSFVHKRADAVVRVYEVISLDIVDSTRVEFARADDDEYVSVATGWPSDTTTVAGNWRYVVTGRLRP